MKSQLILIRWIGFSISPNVIAALRRADIEKPSLNNIQNFNRNTMVQETTTSQPFAKLPVMRRFRVNMLHRGKERWKYCRTIERAKKLQQEATAGGLCSIIYEKVDGSYVAWNGA